MGDYELYHAERKHKYIKKIGNRYFYTQQEIDAYYQDKKPKDAKELALDVRGGASRIKNTALMAPYVKNQPAQQTVEKNPKGKKSGESNKNTRARGKKKLKKMVTKPIRNLKKQASRGKKAIDKYYTKLTTPNITVTYDEAKIK